MSNKNESGFALRGTASTVAVLGITSTQAKQDEASNNQFALGGHWDATDWDTFCLEGDWIELDCAVNRLHLDNSEEELAGRLTGVRTGGS